MNLQSEIEYFQELALLDKARLLNMFLHELAEEARTTYGPGTEQVHDTLHLRFVNEIVHRLTRLIEPLPDPLAQVHAQSVSCPSTQSCRSSRTPEWLVGRR